MSRVEVTTVAAIEFGVGKVGENDHLTPEERPVVLAEAVDAIREHGEGCIDCFDCMDGRLTLSIEGKTSDPEELRERNVGQLAGGTGLAFTKAAVAANAAYLRDARSFEDAYDLTMELLSSFGLRDAAHEGCGASKLVQTSVKKPLSTTQVEGLVNPDTNPVVSSRLQQIYDHKRELAASGFYDDWTTEMHKLRVLAFGGDYSILQTSPDETSGHHELGLMPLKKGSHFAKNEFIEKTGKQMFVLTLEDADVYADKIGGSTEERELIKLALRDDAFNVANHIIAPGLEVFA